MKVSQSAKKVGDGGGGVEWILEDENSPLTVGFQRQGRCDKVR